MPVVDCVPLAVCIGWYLVFALGSFVVSFISSNYSQVDKLWSLTPWLYVWVYVYYSKESNPRLLWMAFVSTIWGIRLTLNFNRRGGYKWPFWEGEEDYRWVHVQEMLRADEYPIVWQFFNLVFICLYQHFLLLALSFPALVAFKNPTVEMNVIDWLLGVAYIGLVVFEMVADNQQWDFQNEKRQHGTTNNFITTGVWSICRHPNYAAEQSLWIVFYGFAVNTTNELFNYSGLGALLLVLLFTPSAIFSEGLSASKYDDYKIFQETTFMFLPLGTFKKMNRSN